MRLAARAWRRSGTPAACAWSRCTCSVERRVASRAGRSPRARSRARSAAHARSTGCARVVGVARVDAQRAAVRRQLLDVEQRQAVRGEDALDGRGARSTRSARGRWCRTGSPPSAACRCGNSIVTTPLRLQQQLACPPRSRSGRAPGPARCCRAPGRPACPSATSSRARSRAEELARRVGTPALDGHLGDVRAPARCRARGMPRCDEVLQQIAVVARRARRPGCSASEAEARRDHRRRSARACASQLSEYDEK